MTSKSDDILVNYLLFLIFLKSFSERVRVRPENGNETQQLVLGDGYTLPSRVIIKLFGFVCWETTLFFKCVYSLKKSVIFFVSVPEPHNKLYNLAHGPQPPHMHGFSPLILCRTVTGKGSNSDRRLLGFTFKSESAIKTFQMVPWLTYKSA